MKENKGGLEPLYNQLNLAGSICLMLSEQYPFIMTQLMNELSKQLKLDHNWTVNEINELVEKAKKEGK